MSDNNSFPNFNQIVGLIGDPKAKAAMGQSPPTAASAASAFAPLAAANKNPAAAKALSQVAPGTPPIVGAKQAADFNWYLPDPGRPGKYLYVSRSPTNNSTPHPKTWATVEDAAKALIGSQGPTTAGGPLRPTLEPNPQNPSQWNVYPSEETWYGGVKRSSQSRTTGNIGTVTQHPSGGYAPTYAGSMSDPAGRGNAGLQVHLVPVEHDPFGVAAAPGIPKLVNPMSTPLPAGGVETASPGIGRSVEPNPGEQKPE